MLLKLLGAGLVVCAAVGRIFSKEMEFAEQRRQLADFQLYLTLLRNEICLLRLPLPLALENCAGQLREPFCALCMDMAAQLHEQNGAAVPALWRTLVDARRGDFLLDDAQCTLLAETGEVLRMDNVEMKQQRMEAFAERLALLTAAFEADLAGRQRINRYGTALAGAFLIILLI